MLAAALSGFVLFGIPAIAGWYLGAPVPEEIDLDATNVAIASGLCLVVSVLFGLLPAVRFSRPSLITAHEGRCRRRRKPDHSRASPGGDGADRHRRAVPRDQRRDARPRAHGGFRFPARRPGRRARCRRRRGTEPDAGFAIRRVRDNLKQAIGVRSVALAEGMPIDFDYREFRVARADDAKFATAHVTRVGENFLETVGAKLLRGRTITAEDRMMAAPVAVISDPLAAQLFPGARSDWRTMKFTLDDGREQESTIVGVTSDFATSQLTTMRPQILLPLPESVARRRYTSSRAARRATSRS